MDLHERQSSLWNELEGILRMLDVNKQIWFLEKFIDESRKFLSGGSSFHSPRYLFNWLGLTADGGEKKTPRMKSAKKKKHKKTVSYDVGNDEEGDCDTAKEKKGDGKEKDSKHKSSENSGCEQREDPSLNVDSLIRNYKEQSQVVVKTDLLENILNLEQPEESEEDTTTSTINLDTGTKSTRFSKNFKRNRQRVEKTRHNLVKREKENEDEKLERAGKLLQKVFIPLSLN